MVAPKLKSRVRTACGSIFFSVPLSPVPTEIAFNSTSGFTPPLAPITKASDDATNETMNKALLVSFSTCAAPGLSPATVTVGPHSDSSGIIFSTVAGSPDTMTDRVPAAAPEGPPEMGQSTIVTPRGVIAASTSRRNF